jgi:hypothetical protein
LKYSDTNWKSLGDNQNIPDENPYPIPHTPQGQRILAMKNSVIPETMMKKKKNHGVTRSFTEEERDFVFPPCISVYLRALRG